MKKFPNGAYIKWNGYKYIPNYDVDKEQDDENVKYIKYRELGQKQYNYDSILGTAEASSSYRKCVADYPNHLGEQTIYTTTTSPSSLTNTMLEVLSYTGTFKNKEYIIFYYWKYFFIIFLVLCFLFLCCLL